MTRPEQVILLLRSRNDWHPGLRSQFASFGAIPGETATEWVECARCEGLRTVSGRTGDEPCPKCEGAGGKKVDAYTGRTDTERETKLFSAEDRAEWRRKLDQNIARLAEQTAPPRSDADLIAEATEYGWERERARYLRAGSYRELDAALEWLTVQSPPARALVGWVYESGADTLGCLHESIERAAVLAVDLLAERMPEKIKVPHWLLPKHPALVRRDAKAEKRNAA